VYIAFADENQEINLGMTQPLNLTLNETILKGISCLISPDNQHSMAVAFAPSYSCWGC